MKKTIFISIGVLIIILVLGIWAYLFTYGTPENSKEIFTRFGIGNTTQNAENEIPSQNEESVVDVDSIADVGTLQRLKQLTTRPVAGAVFIENGIRYVEQGTGHVYDINLTTGEESLIRGTTIPRSADAIFTKDGSTVAITAYEASGNMTTLEEVWKDGQPSVAEGKRLPVGAHELYFGDSTSTLMYLLEEESGSSGYSYSTRTGDGKQIFKTVLRDIHVLWGKTIYVYTTPSSLTEGYIYRISGSDLQYVTSGGRGLVGFVYDDGLMITKVANSVVTSYAQDTSGNQILSPVSVMPEKCVKKPTKRNSLYCSVPIAFDAKKFPDDWYKGIVSYSDILWDVDVTGSRSTVISNFFSESGREIDVAKIGTNEDGTFIYFINKNDNTLWMYDATPVVEIFDSEESAAQ